MRKLTTDEWIKRAKQTHGNRYDYSDTVYVNMRTMIKIRCKIHGVFEQAQRPKAEMVNLLLAFTESVIMMCLIVLI